MAYTISNSTRIAKNTIFLYIRMFILMLVSLYTSRVILEALGVEDYGIYNVVGGIVVLFTFINNAMVTSTQRFLNYEIGLNNFENTQKVFSISVNIHILISILILILSETVGLWLLNSTIQYPDNREWAVQMIYQLSVLTTCVKIIRAPYNAAIIAYEKMQFYAYLSVFEALLQLSIVFMLKIIPYDRLVIYGILLLIVSIIINIAYYWYCRSNFNTCRYVLTKDKLLYKQLLGFSGWSLFGGVANVGTGQGLNIILNVFLGVTVNAAMGISNQVSSALSTLIVNFQTAFKPQLVKSYATGDRKYFTSLIIASSKYSYLLSFIIALPIYICCPEILSIWLTEVPDYSVSFCRMMLIFTLLDALQGPLWYSILATGKIRTYQILMSFLILFNLPLSYICLKVGFNPVSVLIIRCLINFFSLFVRLWYMNKLFDFPIKLFFSDVILRIVPITAIATLLNFLPININTPFVKISVVIIITLFINMILVLTIGLSNNERNIIINKIQAIYDKYKRNR